MKKIAIIGSGPRGISVLERLAAIVNTESVVESIEIIIIDNC